VRRRMENRDKQNRNGQYPDSQNPDSRNLDSRGQTAAPVRPEACLGIAGQAGPGIGVCLAEAGHFGTWVPLEDARPARKRHGGDSDAGREPRPLGHTKLQPPQPMPRGASISNCVPRSQVSPSPLLSVPRLCRPSRTASPRFRCWCWKVLPSGPAVERCYPASADRSPRRPVPAARPVGPSQ